MACEVGEGDEMIQFENIRWIIVLLNDGNNQTMYVERPLSYMHRKKITIFMIHDAHVIDMKRTRKL